MFGPSIPVLCYHDVSDADGLAPKLFGEHLDALADAGWRTITSRELLAAVRGQIKTPRKSLVLTFDDGHVSNWSHAVPELHRRGMTATFFLLSDFTEDGEIRPPGEAPAPKPMRETFRAALLDRDFSQFINRSEARAMLDMGMDIFSHGCRHQGTFITLDNGVRLTADDSSHWTAWGIYPRHDENWRSYKPGSAYVYNGIWPVVEEGGLAGWRKRTTEERLRFCRRDFADSFEFFRDLNRRKEQLFCWPWGHFSNDAEAELAKAGYSGAFTLDRFANVKGTSPYRLHRIGVGKTKDGKWLQTRLRMYGTAFAARVFFKFWKQRPEPDAPTPAQS